MTANSPQAQQSLPPMAFFQDGHPGSPSSGSQILSFNLRSFRGNSKTKRKEDAMNEVRHSVGLYNQHPLANDILAGALKRQDAFKTSGAKQLDHVRATDGWFRSMFVIEVRAIDNYISPLLAVLVNAIFATILEKYLGVKVSHEMLEHWNTVYSLVLTTALAFLLVFRLNRIAIRFWETRIMWGNVTHNTRNLAAGILVHCRHSKHRDAAICWASTFCVATMHFIRNELEINHHELAGFLSRQDIRKLQDANHAPLYAANMCRYYLQKAFNVTANTPPGLAHAYSIQMNNLELLLNSLVSQVSGMERVRSTPLPIVYVTHLRTFIFAYCMFIPYVWVTEWGWSTLPLVGLTAFALFGIEGASSECEVPFDRSRPNHLAMDAYCFVILDAVQGLVVQAADMEMRENQDGCIEEGDIEDTGELSKEDLVVTV